MKKIFLIITVLVAFAFVSCEDNLERAEYKYEVESSANGLVLTFKDLNGDEVTKNREYNYYRWMWEQSGTRNLMLQAELQDSGSVTVTIYRNDLIVATKTETGLNPTAKVEGNF